MIHILESAAVRIRAGVTSLFCKVLQIVGRAPFPFAALPAVAEYRPDHYRLSALRRAAFLETRPPHLPGR
jgi:hypothetical protein